MLCFWIQKEIELGYIPLNDFKQEFKLGTVEILEWKLIGFDR